MSRRVVIYAYDNFNQLTSAKTGGTTAEYTYNGEGLRVKKTVNGETTIYLYEYDRVVLELDQHGRQKARNVYGINLLTREVDGEKYYYLYNGHADVTVLLDASTGSVAASYYYDAFGNILEETGAVNSPILYAGYQYDEETGLYYLNARMYDPKIARFLQEDTYRGDRNDPLSLHLYAYCFNNPLKYLDPTGHMGVAVRTAEEAKGNMVAWKAGAEKGKSIIIVTNSDGTTATLTEGTDYEIGADNRAYYVAREEPGAGGNTPYVGQRKDSGAIAGALDGDIAPSSYATQQRYNRYMLASDETLTINGEAIADGTLLTTIGVTAVIVSVTVLTGGAGLPVAALVVAGGTAVAGTGATVMGTSEVVSGFTGTNWVLEELFDGNVEAYNTGRLIVTFGSTCGTVYLAPYYGVVQPGDAAVAQRTTKSEATASVVNPGEDVASMAKQWQGNDLYPGVDDWTSVPVRKGTMVWGGVPGQSNFYTSGETIRIAGNYATAIFEGLQVSKGSFAQYRPGMTMYELTEDVVVGYSRALSNPQYGAGGFTQYFISNYSDVLKPVHSIILNNR